MLHHWAFVKVCWIKSFSWYYFCDKEYLEDFDQGKKIRYSLSLAVLPRSRLDPVCQLTCHHGCTAAAPMRLVSVVVGGYLCCCHAVHPARGTTQQGRTPCPSVAFFLSNVFVAWINNNKYDWYRIRESIYSLTKIPWLCDIHTDRDSRYIYRQAGWQTDIHTYIQIGRLAGRQAYR